MKDRGDPMLTKPTKLQKTKKETTIERGNLCGDIDQGDLMTPKPIKLKKTNNEENQDRTGRPVVF